MSDMDSLAGHDVLVTRTLSILEFPRLVAAFLGVLMLFVLSRLRGLKSGGKRRRLKLPPGPRPWPIFGSLNLLGSYVHVDLKKLSDEYGPLCRIQLGSVNGIIISSPALAEEALKTKDVVFASRAPSASGDIIFNDHSNVGFSAYGPYWRHARKLYKTKLMTVKRIQQFEKERKAEMLRALDAILHGSEDGKAVHMDHILSIIISNNVCKMAVGKTFYEYCSKTVLDTQTLLFQHTIEDLARLTISKVPGEFFHFLEKFDIGDHKKEMAEFARTSNGILENMMKEHRLGMVGKKVDDADVEDDNKRDLLDVLLTAPSLEDKNVPLPDHQVQGLILEVVAAGIETQTTTLSWVLSELQRNPSVLAKVQEELDSTVGKDRLVCEADLPRLSYLQAVVNETFRLHPPAPVLVPHETTEDAVLGNEYFIAKNSRVFINAWAMAQDPSLWENPLNFNPDRFFNLDIDSSGKVFKFLPFGSGRRGCPGRPLAMVMVHFTLAVLLQSCSWALAGGMKPEELDMSESSRLTGPRVIPLELVASPRLPLPVIFAS